jgi:hypothetical protein
MDCDAKCRTCVYFSWGGGGGSGLRALSVSSLGRGLSNQNLRVPLTSGARLLLFKVFVRVLGFAGSSLRIVCIGGMAT